MKALFKTRIFGNECTSEKHYRVPKEVQSIQIQMSQPAQYFEWVDLAYSGQQSPLHRMPQNLLLIKSGNNATKTFYLNAPAGMKTKDLFIRLHENQELVITGYKDRIPDDQIEIPLEAKTTWMNPEQKERRFDETMDELARDRYNKAINNEY